MFLDFIDSETFFAERPTGPYREPTAPRLVASSMRKSLKVKRKENEKQRASGSARPQGVLK